MFGPISTPNIIDIEASGFGPESYPVEVGIALASGQTRCYLILPRDDWTYWDDDAEKIHRIPRDILEIHGRPIAEVAHNLNELLGTQQVFSDGWEVDKPWLNQLFYAAGCTPSFRLSTLDYILSDAQMERWHAAKKQLIAEMDLKRHRASIDALIIQKTYQRTAKSSQAA